MLDITGNPQQVAAQTDEETIKEPVEIVQPKFVITAEKGLNLRDGPDASSKKLLQLPFKAIVTKEAENGTWFKITTSDGITGWVSSKYLKEFRGE
jgi:N-acetylmuramoyl-L-alanine amidase